MDHVDLPIFKFGNSRSSLTLMRQIGLCAARNDLLLAEGSMPMRIQYKAIPWQRHAISKVTVDGAERRMLASAPEEHIIEVFRPSYRANGIRQQRRRARSGTISMQPIRWKSRAWSAK